MNVDSLIISGVILVSGLLLWQFIRRIHAGHEPNLRPLTSYDQLQEQVGLALESGRQMHVTLGQASLVSAANPTSIAALAVLDHLARDGCANGSPPLVTVGEGTLLTVAQDSLRVAYDAAERLTDFQPGLAQFIAHETDPFAYAGGVATLIENENVMSNVMVGHFGPELVIVAAAANNNGIDQVIGTDDPTALALATAVSEHVLIGEELLAAPAYLEGKPAQIASLQVQDWLRLFIILSILAWALWQLIE